MQKTTQKQIKDVIVGDLVQGKHGVNVVKETPTFKIGNQPLHGFNGRKPFITSMHPIMTDRGWANFNPELYEKHWPEESKEIAALNTTNEILQLNELKPMSGKPEIGDYIRSGKLFGKIVELETRKGKKLAGIEPSSGMPSGFKYGQWGTIVFFDVKKLVYSRLKGTEQIERNVGKPIWVVK